MVARVKLKHINTMQNIDNVIQEIKRVELTIFNVRKELKTLKKRIGGYKGWTKRYRKQQKQLRQDKLELQQELSLTIQERDLAIAELNKVKLSASVQEGIKAKKQRDIAIAELDNLINQIEAYKKVCKNYSVIRYADKNMLIKEAENILFGEEVLEAVNSTINERDHPQMFTDCASINRSLLDK